MDLSSPIQAANGGTLLDEDGDSSDWIELYNTAPTGNTRGWRLTDESDTVSGFRTRISPPAVLVVFVQARIEESGTPCNQLRTRQRR